MVYNLRQIFEKLDATMSQTPNLQIGRFVQEICIERHTIEKAVRESVGMCFREYRKQRLLEESRRLLMEELSLSVKEIAFKLGYRSRDAFCRFVKTNTGTNPSNIRRTAPH